MTVIHIGARSRYKAPVLAGRRRGGVDESCGRWMELVRRRRRRRRLHLGRPSKLSPATAAAAAAAADAHILLTRRLVGRFVRVC